MASTFSTIRKALVVAGICVVAMVAAPVTGVGAQDNSPADPGVRCGAKIGPGEYEFYLPGAKVKDVNGNTWICGPDGMWFKDYTALKAATITRVPTGSLTTSGTGSLAGLKTTTTQTAGTFQMAR